MSKGVYVRTEAIKETLRLNAAKSRGFHGKHTEESKAKMRAAKLERPTKYWLGKVRGSPSEETKAKMRASATPMPEHIRAMGTVARRGSHHSPDAIAKMRASLSRPDVKAKIRSSVFGKPCRHAKRVFIYNGRRFRSSYETRVASALDTLGMAWTYEQARFDCGTFTYAPDFHLSDEEVYWEVKGWFGPDSRRKVEAFRRLYPDVQLVVFDITCLKSLEAAVRKAA